MWSGEDNENSKRRHGKMKRLLIAVTCVVVGLLVAQTINRPQPQGQPIKAVVSRVIDGDTIEVYIPSEDKTTTVRVIGYGAPELSHPFGDTAALFVKSFLEGREVLLEPDAQALDRYGRRLYHVWIPNVLLSELMLLTGLGIQMTIPPNTRHADFLRRAENAAMNIGLGMWSLSKPSISTYIFRQTHPMQARTQPSDIVYVTQTGKKYHRYGCRYLRHSAIPMSRSQALASGYEPCSVCNP